MKFFTVDVQRLEELTFVAWVENEEDEAEARKQVMTGGNATCSAIRFVSQRIVEVTPYDKTDKQSFLVTRSRRKQKAGLDGEG